MTRDKLFWVLIGLLCFVGFVGGMRQVKASDETCFSSNIAMMQRALNVPEADAQKFTREFGKRFYSHDGDFLADSFVKFAYAISVDNAILEVSQKRWMACNALLAEKKIPGLAMPTNFVSVVTPKMTATASPKLK